MRKPRINMTIIKEISGYSATAKVGNNFIATEAENYEELKSNVLEAVNLTFEEKGIIYKPEEIRYCYDLESFFYFYNVINVKALSERIGMNQSLLAQYIKGIKKPSQVQTKRILNGVQQIGRELSEVQFLV
ncbi:MAG: XRE family transcriptional regulator [Bacteroidetes bacterium]|nr:XRE family transcriptional regulator [Bacteroidota bacterium]